MGNTHGSFDSDSSYDNLGRVWQSKARNRTLHVDTCTCMV